MSQTPITTNTGGGGGSGSANEPKNDHYFCLKDTADAIVRMGVVNVDGVISAFKVTCATDLGVPHYFQMDKTGGSKTNPRKGGTIFRGPGPFKIQHGDAVEKDIPGVYIDSGNGDLVLKSQGRIRIEAQDIDLIAHGGGGEHGVININANEKILANSKGSLNISTNVDFHFHTNKTARIIGMGGLKLYGGNNGPDLISSDEVAWAAPGSKGYLGLWKTVEEVKIQLKTLGLW